MTRYLVVSAAMGACEHRHASLRAAYDCGVHRARRHLRLIGLTDDQAVVAIELDKDGRRPRRLDPAETSALLRLDPSPAERSVTYKASCADLARAGR